MSPARRILAALAIASVAGLSGVACGSEEPNTGTDLAAPPASTALTTAAPAVEAPSAGGTEVGETEIEPPVPGNAPAAVPPVPNRDDVNVDARDFEQGDGQFFFISPSGNVHCGLNSLNAPGTDVGCQVRYSVPGNTGRECLNTDNNTYGVQILNGGTVEQICTNQGIFVGSDSDRVLEYGQTIGVQGTFCRSTEAGIACYSGSESGFMISRDVNLAF